MARNVDAQRRERRDFDRNRNKRPVEPGAGDRGELDVAKANSMAMAQPQVAFPESEKCKGQNKSTQRGSRDVFRQRPGFCVLELTRELADRIARHLLQESAARGEVVGEMALADAGRLGDAGLRQLVRAALRQELQRRLQDALADLHLVILPNGH